MDASTIFSALKREFPQFPIVLRPHSSADDESAVTHFVYLLNVPIHRLRAIRRRAQQITRSLCREHDSPVLISTVGPEISREHFATEVQSHSIQAAITAVSSSFAIPFGLGAKPIFPPMEIPTTIRVTAWDENSRASAWLEASESTTGAFLHFLEVLASANHDLAMGTDTWTTVSSPATAINLAKLGCLSQLADNYSLAA